MHSPFTAGLIGPVASVSLALAAVTACVGPATSSQPAQAHAAAGPSVLAPELEPEPETKLGAAPDTRPRVGPLPKLTRSWGEEPLSVIELSEGTCTTYSETVVLERGDEIAVDHADVAAGCAMTSTTLHFGVGSFKRLEGVVGTVLFFSVSTGADFTDVSAWDFARAKELFSIAGVAPASRTTVNVRARTLTYATMLDFPDGCGSEVVGHSNYLDHEQACWPAVLAEHPGLVGHPPPQCDCGDSGLGPWPYMYRTISLDDPTYIVEHGPAMCGCLS